MSEKIIIKDSSEQFKEDYKRYGIYVMFRRILTDFKDGFKPVQRRILYAMYKERYLGKAGKVKSSAVVGDVMKRYHPHGDDAIYNTIKPMANWFESKLPIIGAGGGWGTFQGKPPSAPRYTECYLTKFAQDVIFGDLSESGEAVDWGDNYDRTVLEPEYLPVRIPLLIIEGSFGIGLGIKAEIPSHNINEVIDATINLIKNPDAPVTLIPDHCMPCEIIDTDFDKISRAGYGNYRVRGIIDIENYEGKTALVIKSIPNLTFLDTITEKIDNLILAKKIIQIEVCYDKSRIEGPRYVIVLKPGSDPEYVKNVIYSNTEMEQNCKVNMYTLDGMTPMRMSYKAYLQAFIEFRKLVKFRIYMNRLQEIQTKIHERDAFIKAIESGEIDNIIAMIKTRKDTDDTPLIEHLVTRLKITDLQASFIINCDLKKLSIGYLNFFKKSRAELEEQRKIYQVKTINEDLIIQDIIDELIDIRKKYGEPRKCKIIKAKKSMTDDIPAGEMKVVITERNFIKKVPSNLDIGIFKNDNPKRIITIDNRDNLLLFDNMGKVFKLPVNNIPFSDRVSNGTDIRFMVKGLTANVAGILSENIIRKLEADKRYVNYVVCVTTNGLLKKMDLADFLTIPPSGVIYCKVDNDDSVNNVIVAGDNLGIILYSDKKAVRVNVSDIAYLKRNTKGSRAFNSENGIDGICVINNTSKYIIVITKSGMVNKFDIVALPATNTSSKKGLNIIKLNKIDGIRSVLSLNDNDIIKITTMLGVKEVRVTEIPNGSSISTGIKMIPMKNDKIVKIEAYC